MIVWLGKEFTVVEEKIPLKNITDQTTLQSFPRMSDLSPPNSIPKISLC